MKALKLYFILSFLVIGTVVLDGQDLVILHTNDTHSQITPQTSGDGAGLGGYERREAYVNSVRSEMGADKVLLLDAGDFSQGTPYFSIFKGDVANKLTITNKTTDQKINYSRALTSNDTLIIDGLIPIENDQQMYYASDHGYIDFKKGWNDIQITGATNFTVSFDTKFYY